ncbi:phage tail tube protein [uncultured Acinetobacter sp.]|uniref:phage tail tube protein n=1 Tax=uncultured Acinetobacter sp. TaxID=165433 RepID=UPI00374A40DA
MAKKGVLSQGTQVWILHGSPLTLTRILCVKAIVWGDDSSTDINSTCLDEPDTATSEQGLNTPGDGSLQIDTDPKNATHMILLQAAQAKEEVGVYVGWSDGVGTPTLTSGTVELPDTRSWSYATARLRKGSPVFDADSLVNHTIPMKRQTEVIDEFKVV